MTAKNPHRFRVSKHRRDGDWEMSRNTHYAFYDHAVESAERLATIDCFDEIRILFRIKGVDHPVRIIHELEIKRRCKEFSDQMEKENREAIEWLEKEEKRQLEQLDGQIERIKKAIKEIERGHLTVLGESVNL